MLDKTVMIEKTSSDTPPTECPSILIVEDEPQLRNLLAEVLECQGYMVSTAPSADDASDILVNETFDVILSDVMMPGKSGITLLEEIKEKDPYQEFIIMTGYPKVTAAVHAIKIGAFDYVSKPFEISEIKERVESAIKHRQKRIASATGTAIEGDEDDERNTRKIAGYSIVKTLGEGTMGIVFLVKKTIDGEEKEFAIKVIKNQPLTQNKDTVERFFKEAKSASQMESSNIIKVFEHGYAREENIPYLVMEFFKGKSLKSVIEISDDVSYEDKVDIIIQITQALEEAHGHHIVHRDIKPDNILIDEDFGVKLSDFGIAQLPDSDQTNLMRIIGTPYYLSPEAYNCPKVDNRSDLYSLGTVAYELCTGHKPFDAENISSLGFKVQSDNPIQPNKIHSDFPLPLQNILEKLLKKSPAKRYQTATEVLNDLRPLQQKENLYKRGLLQRSHWNTLR